MTATRERFRLDFAHPPVSAAEAPFFGNGQLGSLLTLKDGEVVLTLDHPGLWELRDGAGAGEAPAYASWRDLGMRAREALFDSRRAGRGPHRTRLPALSLAARPTAPVDGWAGALRLRTATGEFSLGSAGGFALWIDSAAPILVIEGEGVGAWAWEPRGWDLAAPGLALLREWGYERARVLPEIHRGFSALAQPFGADAVAVAGVLRLPGLVLATVEIGSREQTAALAAHAVARLRAWAGERAARRARQESEWAAYWARADLVVPEPELQAAVDVERYKLFCNARAEGPPVTLQGVFNRADILPPWCGDLHHNLNVQACYWAAWKLNASDLARGYVETLAAQRGRFEERARRLFGVEGALHLSLGTAPTGEAVPSEFDFWTTLTGMELFAACDFIWHTEHSGDAEFRERAALPWLRATARLWRALAEPGADGRLHFPRTHSPEVFDNGEMILATDAAFVVSSLGFILEKLVAWESDAALATEWRRFRDALPPLPVNATGLRLFADQDLRRSHRHFCHLFPIFPLGTLDRAKPDEDALIQASLDTLTRLGPMEFAAWSFPYLAILAARGGRGDMAALNLETYRRAFRSANTFTVNGDVYRTGAIAASDHSAGAACDAFTLEAGLMVPAAVAEMLAHRAGDTLWILPALPRAWRDCAAEKLTLPGGHRVSLCLVDGRLKALTIEGGADEKLRLRVLAPGTWPDFVALRAGGTCSLAP